MEIWDLYDTDRNKNGETMQRGNLVPERNFHLVVHVCIFNSKNEMLIQKRQSFKQGWPNLWDLSVGGSAVSGDNSCTAAERETLEEIGYKIDLCEKRPHLTVNFPTGFDDYYLVEEDLNIEELKLQVEEVQAVKWASKAEILRLMDSGEFIPYYKNLIELFFEMRKGFGAIIE